eukprot:jgi/Tetstr1/459738/TSEL_005091.t1
MLITEQLKLADEYQKVYDISAYFITVISDYNMEDIASSEDRDAFEASYLDAVGNAINLLGITSDPDIRITGMFAGSQRAERVDRKTSPVEFAEGDKVWLSTEHLLVRNQPARTFRQRYIGPYPVTAKISSQAYRLRLPPTFGCHNVFHISRLRQCVNPDTQPDTIPSSVGPPVDEFVVERVLDFSIERREDMFKRGLWLVFLVRWLNYDSSHDIWEPYSSALRRVEALHDFARVSRHLQNTLRSKEYANLRARHPSRFPESIPER